MKPGVILLVCVASGVIGALVANLGSSGDADEGYSRESLDGDAAEVARLRERVTELERALDALKNAPMLTTRPPPEKAAAETAAPPAPPAGAASSDESQTARRSPRDALSPPADRETLDTVEGWKKDEDFRRKWLFAGERDILMHFGSPDGIFVGDGGVERWTYKRDRKVDVMFYFHRSRVIRMYPD